MEFWLLLGGGFVLYAIISAMKKSTAVQGRRAQGSNQHQGIRVKMTSSSGRSSRDEDDDEDFATFTISYGRDEPKSKNKKPGKWIAPGEKIEVHGQTITKGYFYLGGKLAALDNHSTESSLVDDSLKAKIRPVTFEDESLGYWPKYITLSENGRGAYLSWLASDRDNPDTPVGYVFIYFYGLERRIVVDSIKGEVSDSEFKAIFEEIIRLKNIFHGSRSFLNYSTKLLEIMCLLRPGVVSHPELEKNPKQDSVLLKYRLAKTVKNGDPIPAHLALAWLKFIPDYALKKPARRCAFEFGQLFGRIYTNTFGDGMTVKPNKTKLKIEYLPASSSLRGIKIPHEDLPDPSNLQGPAKKLMAIADECTEALDPYSRYLGKAGTSRTDIAAVLLLPDLLNDVSTTLGLSKFKKWAEQAIAMRSGLVDVSEFWQFTKTPPPAKINKKESELIYKLAEKAGFGVAPDARYHHAKPAIDGKIVLFGEGHGPYFTPSKAYNETAMALRLGAMVAAIDSHIDESESAQLRRLVDHDTNLSPVERRSLHAYLVWRLNSPTNTSGLKARLETLGTKDKSTVSKILVSVALSDGRIDPDEIKQLEKLYTMLGLDKSLVTADIHGLATTSAPISSASPPPASITSGSEPSTSTGVNLDEQILALHESQTRDVQSMLSAIFEDETSLEEEQSIEDSEPGTDDVGIDSQHYELFEKLINKDRWPREEIDELCKALGLMTSGAIETINDWAFEKVDAAVLEEEVDAVYVDQEIVKELEG